MKLSRRTIKSLDLECDINLFNQQASESTASSYISCYHSPISIQIHFSQMNLWSRGIERSDEWLLTAISDHLLLRKTIGSYLATSCLITQYKTYGTRSHAGTLIICKLDANDIYERKRPIYAKSHSHALVHLNLWKINAHSCQLSENKIQDTIAKQQPHPLNC